MWTLKFTKKADKVLDKLPIQQTDRIIQFLKERVAKTGNPRLAGKAMVAEWTGHIRYRVGDYRVICKIEDETITILVIEIGHRREIYR
jgi:mRNA interferase RelE/StbE